MCVKLNYGVAAYVPFISMLTANHPELSQHNIYCHHCHLLYPHTAVPNVDQLFFCYYSMGNSRWRVYLHAELDYLPIKHSRVIPGMLNHPKDLDLAIYRNSYLQATPPIQSDYPDAFDKRLHGNRLPWGRDARAIICAHCKYDCCLQCDRLLIQRLEVLDPDSD